MCKKKPPSAGRSSTGKGNMFTTVHSRETCSGFREGKKSITETKRSMNVNSMAGRWHSPATPLFMQFQRKPVRILEKSHLFLSELVNSHRFRFDTKLLKLPDRIFDAADPEGQMP